MGLKTEFWFFKFLWAGKARENERSNHSRSKTTKEKEFLVAAVSPIVLTSGVDFIILVLSIDLRAILSREVSLRMEATWNWGENAERFVCAVLVEERSEPLFGVVQCFFHKRRSQEARRRIPYHISFSYKDTIDLLTIHSTLLYNTKFLKGPFAY